MHKIPLFPLNTVLFPGGILPLRIFEARYLDMISECLKNNKGFGVCLIRNGHETGAPAVCHETGTYAEIVDWDKKPDGLLHINALGTRRFVTEKFSLRPNKLVEGEVSWLESVTSEACPESFESLQEVLKQIVDYYELPYKNSMEKINDAGWLGDRLSELLPLELDIKQQLLELSDPIMRLKNLNEILAEFSDGKMLH